VRRSGASHRVHALASRAIRFLVSPSSPRSGPQLSRLAFSQVKAEFDSFKAMTRRMIKSKDEELARLLHMEEVRAAPSPPASRLRPANRLAPCVVHNRPMPCITQQPLAMGLWAARNTA
jgi:hypothetical protein